MKNHYLLIGLAAMFLVGCQSTPDLYGTWTVDTEASTDIEPWGSIEYTFREDGDAVFIRRDFRSGRYGRSDSMIVEPGGPARDIPMEPSAKWFDQPHLGVFIGIDKTQSVEASWIEAGKELLVKREVPLETAQGQAVSQIEERFKMDGDVLKATINRSSRPTEIEYTLRREM